MNLSGIRKFNERFKLVEGVLHKRCTNCKQFVPHEKFTKAKNTTDKKTPNCNECRNKKRDNAKVRQYYRNNWKEKKARYFQENKTRIYEQRKQKRKSCPLANMYIRVRKFVRKARLHAKQRDRNRSVDIIGCSKSELLAHLISTFEKNYKIKYEDKYFKDLHIDHIVPLSTGKCYDDFLKLNHYTNLQFLHKDHNLEKKNNINYCIPDFPISKYTKEEEITE